MIPNYSYSPAHAKASNRRTEIATNHFFDVAFCLLLAFLFAGILQLNAQIPQVKPQRVIPPSPDAASLGKYGSIPVGLHTGVPQIEIPIYTIKEGSLELPISLSYHASGIKVSEIASWVGLGWTLNAGGAISKSIVGRSDEHGFFQTNVKSAGQITESDFEFLKPFADGAGDYESDYYFYNFNGHSGKFIFEQNNSITPFLIPKAPIKIVNGITHFAIVDEWGTTYTFDATETMEISGSDVPEQVTSSYYLTRIISADGKDQITLTYNQDPGYVDGGTTYTETIGQSCSMAGSPSNDYHISNALPFGRTIYPMRLSGIFFSTGKVQFIKEPRSDLGESGSRLGEIQIFARNSDGTYETQPQKTFVLNNDYYFGSGLNSRLKLVGLEEKDNLTSTIKKYVFSYVESPALPPRSSSAQDWWGFYNEQTGNTSLIATQTIGFNGFAYAVGASNREPDAAAMQAGTLNKIVYPTGGYTEFYYEPHYYLGTGYDVVSVEAKCGTVGNTTDLLEETKVFTPPTSGWVTVHTYCSNVTDAEPFFSRVFLRKQGVSDYLIEHYYTPYDYSPYEPHLYKDFTVYLESGATYELKVMSKGTSESPQFNYAAFSQASLSYQQEVPNATLMAGGLRVNEIRDYESPSARPVTRIFKYGVGETGAGILLIPQYGISNAKQEIDVEWYQATCGNEYPNACCVSPSCFAKRLMISGTAALDLTSLNGAPVVYDEVTVYENSVASANGRSVHKFDVQEDEFTYADKAYNNGHWQVDNTWKGGDEIWSASYIENSTAMTEENSAGYAVYGIQQTIGTKIGYRVQTEGCSPSNQTESVLFSRLYYFDVPFYSGIRKLISSRERRHSSTDPSKYVETLTTYEYDDLASNHQQLSRKIVLSSAGGNYSSHYWYAADYDASVDNIQSLLNSHIIGTPIKEEIHRDGKLVEGKVTHLNELGRPIELYRYESSTAAAAPAHDRTVLVPSGYVKKYDITYDPETKNVASTIPMDDVTTSFLWGYNNRLPVAEITNADVSSVIYTSFEENGVENTGAKTGSKVWSGVFTLPLPSSAGQYNLFYWKRTGTGAWEPVTQSLAVTAPNETINIGMAGSIIDEVRVAPPGAQMTTYTYDLLKGITSKTDVNNVTSYFRYDAAGRLASMVDDNGNTLKTFSYHYKGQ